MDKTATEILGRVNLRRNRAEALANALVSDLRREMPDMNLRVAHEVIAAALHRNGAAWTTDEDRKAFGFDPRDELGWTLSEKAEFERRKMDAMLAIFSPATAPIVDRDSPAG